jgi:hypothetical protein
MNRPKVISHRYLPNRIPLFQTAVLWLLLDRLGIDGALSGVIWTVWAIAVSLMTAVFFFEKCVHPRDL